MDLEQQRRLIGMDINEARRWKWSVGVVKHRGVGGGEREFQGDPVLELYEEILDALNYVEYGRERLGPVLSGMAKGTLMRLAVQIQLTYRLDSALHGQAPDGDVLDSYMTEAPPEKEKDTE